MSLEESFFSSIVSKDRVQETFFEDCLFLAVHEWHLTPEEFMEMEIPMLFILLKKQTEYNKSQERALKRK